ncbi:MAG: hypothetical protein AB1679_29900 [Actinomycetota bacterium]
MLGRRELVAAVSAALMAGLAVFTAGVDDGRVVEVRVAGRPAPGPETTLATASTSGSGAHAGRVVWAEKGDVWLYDADTGRRRALTTDGDTRHDFEPRFRDPSHVTYLSAERPGGQDPALVSLDLAGGERRVLRQLTGWVGRYAWSPDGKTFAYYHVATEGGATELHIVGDGPPRMRRFEPIRGRGGFVNYDETRLEWSPDGRRLLLVDTALDTAVGPSAEQILHVLNADGSDAVPPGLGTWARWSADSGTIYCLCSTDPEGLKWRWEAVDIALGTRTPLPISAGARPAVSPDGRFLAFDDGDDTPSVHVLDLGEPTGRRQPTAGPGPRRDRPRFLARAALAPIWLTPTRLAVTDTRPCPHTEDQCLAGGHGALFEPAGTASAIDLATGRRSPLPPIPTDGADTAPAK